MKSARHTFILRLSRDAAGRVRGVLERVRTGEKVQVEELGALGPLVAQMLRAGEDDQIGRTEEQGGVNVVIPTWIDFSDRPCIYRPEVVVAGGTSLVCSPTGAFSLSTAN